MMVFNVRAPGPFARVSPHDSSTRGYHATSPALPEVPISILNSKLLSTFKLPKFDGVGRSWKLWEKSFQRFLGLHQLDYVLEENFPELLWVNPGAKAANKMVFFLIEYAVAAGTLGSKLVRQATKWNGHEAFVMLRNRYVFCGPQTATILLAELSKVRLQRDEDASSFCLRLVELIEDLELVPGDAVVYLTDTQKLGYLLSAIRHETGLQAVYSQLQSEQLRGAITFESACRELHHRVEAMKADDYMDSRPGKALVSTEHKKHGQAAVPVEKFLCLAKDCLEMIQPYLPLCKLCYLQSMAGKISVLVLRDGLGNAVFNATTKKLDFPVGVPKSRFPQKGLKKGRKVLMARLHGMLMATDPDPMHQGRSLPAHDSEVLVVSGGFLLASVALTNQNAGMDGFSSFPLVSVRSDCVGANENVVFEDDVSVSVLDQLCWANLYPGASCQLECLKLYCTLTLGQDSLCVLPVLLSQT